MDPEEQGAIDTGENYTPPATPVDESAGLNTSAPGPQSQAAIPDVGPAPAMAQQTMGQGLSEAGQKIGQDVSQGWENFKQSAPVRAVGRAAGMLTGNEPDTAGMNIKKMLAGEGALSPQLLDEVAAKAPGKTPADKQVAAIHDAYQKEGPDAAAAILQANRVAYGAKSAFARTALMGTQTKPPDLTAAIKAANQAQENLPDGSNVIFSPGGQGQVVAVAQLPGSKRTVQYNLSTPQFAQFLDVGNDGQFDKLMDVSAPAMLQRLVGAQADSGLQTGTGTIGTPAGGTSVPWKPGESTDEASTNDRQDASVADFKSAHPAPPNPYGAPHAQSLDAFPGNDMQFAGNTKADDAIDTANRKKGLYAGDQGAIPGTHDAQGHYLGPAERNKTNYGEELEARSQAAVGNGNVSNESARQKYMATEEEKELARENQIAVAAEKGKNAIEVARQTGAGRVGAATVTAAAKERGWKYASDAKRQIAADAMGRAQMQEQGKNQRSALANQMGLIKKKIETGATLSDDENALAKKYGAAADQALRVPQVAAPQAPTPQAQASQARPPNVPAGAKQYQGKWYTRGPNGEAVPVQ